MASGETIELIVLSTTKVGEKALVVHTLSREWGRRGFLVHSGAKAGMSRFLPLNILEAEVVPEAYRPQRCPFRYPAQHPQKYDDPVPLRGTSQNPQGRNQ